MGKQSRQQHRQAKSVVQTKQHRGCYNEDYKYRHIVEQLHACACIENQAALKGGYRYSHIVDYRYSHSRLQVAIVDYRQPKQTACSQLQQTALRQLQQTIVARLQVAKADYRQPQQTAVIARQLQPYHIDHSRLQVAIVDCRYSYSRLQHMYRQYTLTQYL